MSTARSFSFICLVLAVVGGVSGREYTVSGVSSGAFMAIQNHVAYNKDVVGVAAIAGGPFFCAQAKLEIALHACMVEPEFISVEELVAVTYSTYATTGTIDSPAYTAGDKIWLFSGVQDHKVNSGVVAKAYTYYTGIGADESDMELRNDIQAAHAMVTDNFGNDCTYFGSPYIDNCSFFSFLLFSSSFFSFFSFLFLFFALLLSLHWKACHLRPYPRTSACFCWRGECSSNSLVPGGWR